MAYRRKAGLTISTSSDVYPSSPRGNVEDDKKISTPTKSSATTPRNDNRSLASNVDENTDSNTSKDGFWGIVARKAKFMLDEDDQNSNVSSPTNKMKSQLVNVTPSSHQESRTMDHKRTDNIQESHSRTNELIPEMRKLQIRKRGTSCSDTFDPAIVVHNTSRQCPVFQPVQSNHETQLKASRDVAMATATKAKLLLRELKTVKADLAFTKERCSQLEEENKRLRECRAKGNNLNDDDDMIRLQLETLLAEKARLAHENSIYSRENRFLREIVEYHQLTMQDVVCLDEGAEEVTQVYPFSIDDTKVLCSTPTSPYSPIYPSFRPEIASLNLLPEIKEQNSGEEEASSCSNLAVSTDEAPITPSVSPSID